MTFHAPPPPASDSAARLTAALCAHYAIERELGRGGMATVYLARDVKHGRAVAVKVLSPELSNTVGTERFLREIQIAARLQHPHILPLHDSGSADGFLYYVMPYIPEETLRARLEREKQLGVEGAIRVAREVGQALAYAHGQGVIHRDIKPANILFSAGHALVADFGIARAIESGAGEALTSTGLSIGTPAYMSPEQADSRSDARSDLYSLGCVLYEMLVGEPPFGGPTIQVVMARHALEAPRSIRNVRPAVPAALEEIVFRSLAKVPADRFPTVVAFVEALASVRTDVVEEQMAVPLPHAPPPPNSIAVLPFADLSTQRDLEYFCDGMTEEVIEALARVRTLRVVSRRSVMAFKGKNEDIRQIGRQLNVGTVLEGSVRTAGDRLRVAATLSDVRNGFQLWSERYDRSMADVFAVQDEIAQTIVGTLQAKLSGEQGAPLVEPPTENVEAYRLYLKGRHFWNKRFEGGLQKAIECFEEALEHDPLYARAYSGLADCFLALGTFEFLPPKDAFPRAIAAAQKALEMDDAVAEPHASLGLATMYHRHDWGAAEASLMRAMTLNPEYASAHQFYAIWLAARGQLDPAIVEMRRAAELDPLSPIFSACVGWMEYFAGRYQEAIASCRSTLEMHPGFAVARGILGQAYVEASEFEHGIRELEETARTFPPAVGALGYAYGVAGRTAEAEGVLAGLQRRSEQGYVAPYNLAMVYAGLGDRNHALDRLERAYEDRSSYAVLVAVNPMFARLRADPRFDALLSKMKLAPTPPG